MIDKSSIISLRRKLEKEAWEIKSLGEIATEISTGREVKKDQLGTGDYPIIYWPEILTSKECANITECAHRANLDLIKSPKYCQYGDLLMVHYCKRLSTLGKCVVYLGNEKPVFSDNIFKIEHGENPKFLLHSLSGEFVKKQIQNLVENTVVVNLKNKHLQQIKISLPPRHIQDKVADFLDKFSKLKEQIEEELNKELKQRKKQYEYYKEAVLEKEINKWESTTLDKVATEITSGREVTRSQLGTGNYPAIKFINNEDGLSLKNCRNWVDLESIKTRKFCEYGDILMIKDNGTREHVGKAVVYLGNEKPVIGNHVFLLKHKQNGKFLSYVLSSEFSREQINSQIRGSVINGLTKTSFQHIKIPLPPLEEQNKIVEILDKLRVNIENLQKEIPLLIQDLKKQYTYYREQILNLEITS